MRLPIEHKLKSQFQIGILLLFIALGLSAQHNSNKLTNFAEPFRLKYSELNQKEINSKANIEISIELQEIINEMLADFPENEQEKFINEQLSDLPNLQCVGLLYSGIHHTNKRKLETAAEQLEKARACLENSNNNYFLAEMFFARGELEDVGQEYNAALNSFQSALTIYQELDLPIKVISCYNSLGVINHRFKQWDKAIEYFERGLEVTKSDPAYNENRMLLNNNIAKIHIFLADYDKALENLNEAIAYCEDKGPNGKYRSILNNMGSVYMEVGEVEKGTQLKEQAIELIKESRDTSRAVAYEIELAYYLSKVGKANAAKSKLENAYRSIQLKKYDHLNKQYFATAKEVYRDSRDYEMAYNAFQQYVSIRDSQLNEKTQAKYLEMQEKFESAEKEVTIQTQKSEIKQQRNQRNLFLVFGVFTSVIGLFLWNRINLNKRIFAQEKKINKQKITELEKEKKILTMSSMIQGQEAERKRIAQDLHDGLGGLLASVKTKFGIIQNQIQELNSLDVYNEANTMLDNACTEVRKIAHNMMPDALTKLGLVEAVNDIALHYGEMKVNVIDLGMLELNETQKVMLYRVIQEFLNNTRKHAVASEVIIQFYTEGNSQLIYLEDNGGGFDAFAINENKGLGLKSMESRINYINGTMELNSVIGEGTTMTISIPGQT